MRKNFKIKKFEKMKKNTVQRPKHRTEQKTKKI